MASRSPSLLALLGLAAVAGYQNREKLSELFGQVSGSVPYGTEEDRSATLTGGFDLRSILGAAPSVGLAGTLFGGLAELARNAGSMGGETARKLESWVGNGQNLPVSGADIRALVGEETLNDLAVRTGLAVDELEARLAAILPEAINHMTPEGRIPSDNRDGYRVPHHG